MARPLINFVRGWPSPLLLPSDMILKATAPVLSDSALSTPALQYAPDWGHDGLLVPLASFLTQFHSPDIPISPKRLCITGGASQSLAIALNTMTDPAYTRAVWVCEPSYFLAFRMMHDAGLQIRSIEDGYDGIDFEDFRRQLEAVEATASHQGEHQPMYKPMPRAWPTKLYKHIIYCVPSFSNPTGRCMPLDSRLKLVRLARQFDALVICDDVYDCLAWHIPEAGRSPVPLSRAAIPRIVDVDKILDGGTDRTGADGFGNVLSNGTFSKITGPGVRTGWVEGTPKLAYALSQAGPCRSGGASSGLMSMILGQMMAQGHVQEHIKNTLVPSYQRRWNLMMLAIEKYLVPLGATVPWGKNSIQSINLASDVSQEEKSLLRNMREQSGSDLVAGGYFVYIRLPHQIDATLFANQAKKQENVILQTEVQCRVPSRPGTSLSHDKGPSNRFIRLCFAWEPEQSLVQGVERLRNVLQTMLQGSRDVVTDGTTVTSIDEFS